jgi:CheY-like chemotaxis protein
MMPHVLIADDDRILRKRISRAITDESNAATVHEAGNAEEAMSLMMRQPMDVVITDIQMPKSNGLMLLAFLNAFAPKVPCFVITAYGTSRLKSKMPPDLLRFYEKPFDVRELALSAVTAANRSRDSGACDGIRLSDFIGLAASDQVTATVTVTCEGRSPCKLFLKEGELVDAVAGGERGETAAIRALGWRSPNFSIKFGIPESIERAIRTPLTQLLRIVSERFDSS